MGTMAYLSTVSNKATNTFTGSKGISLKLTETNWGTDENGDGTIETKGEGMTAAENYTPGTVIKKNPILTNSTQEDGAGTEWVAIAVSYKLKDIPKTDSSTTASPIPYSLLKYFIKSSDTGVAQDGIAFNGNWVRIDVSNTSAGELTVVSNNDARDNQAFAIFLYNQTLGKDISTDALFEKVVIKTQDELGTDLPQLNTDLKSIVTNFDKDNKPYKVDAPAQLPNFEINVIGAAIKNEYKKSGDNTVSAEAIGELSPTDLSNLKTNLVTILKEHIGDDVKQLNGTAP